jgi:FixJ family two-component response regulator
VSSKTDQSVPGVNDAPLIHIIDDDESMRLALDTLLRSVALATRLHSSVDAFLKASRPDAPGCLILDIRLPGISGLDFQVQLAQLDIRLPVILMTGHGDVPMSVRGMKAGAIDFLIKPFRDQDMLDAISIALSRDRVRRTADAASESIHERFELLSPRERQIMQLVSAGNMNKQVAVALGVSEITVKIHRGSAMRKMRARTLADLVRMAEALGLAR